MKAIQFTHHGGPEVMEMTDRAILTPQEGEILIRMAYAGISRPDKLMRSGIYPWTNDILPFYPGLYGAGYVKAIGPDVTEFTVGQRVYVEHPIACGCYAEYKIAPTQYVCPVPDGTDLSLASIAASHLIVWGMLTECFPHAEGKTLYISGAAGSIGTAVVQIAPLLGMRVIASASTPEKCEYLRSIGAKEVFCYTEEPHAQKVLELTGGEGADIIMDQSVGEDFCKQLDYLAPMGTILIYNHTKGFPTENVLQCMTTAERFGRAAAVRVFSFHYYDDKPELLAQKKREMFALLGEGKLRPHIGAMFPLSKVQEAHELLDSGNFFGSIVLDCQAE